MFKNLQCLLAQTVTAKTKLIYSKTFKHDKLCKFKLCECPRKECKKTFLWLPSGPKGHCTDHTLLINQKQDSHWIFSLFLNRIYNPDSNRVRLHGFFKSLLLLRGQQAFKGETLDRLALKIFKETTSIYFSLVCLDNSNFPLAKNARLIDKSKYFISCHINCGHGPFMIGKVIRPLFTNVHCPKDNCLCLTPEFLSKFEQRSRTLPCVECSCPEQHLHFSIIKIN